MSTYSFYIGTHAPASMTCIYRCEADFENLAFSTLDTIQGIPDPTYLAGPANGVLYALGKTPEGGAVYALRQESGAIDAASNGRPALAVMNSLLSAGQGPCHISLDPRGEYLLCANYGSGSAALFALGRDGSLQALSDFRRYSGVGYDSSDRQKGPHAHFASFHSERNEVLVCDLGLDMVYVYELDRVSGKLLDTDRSIRLPDGAGPRHLAFHDSHPGMLFVIAEMANTIFSYRFDEASRQYILAQSVSAVPAGPDCDEVTPSDRELMLPPTADNGSIGCAIRFSSDGKYLFVSSRLGYQSISAFRCGDDGQLRFCSRCLCGGITPRDFNVLEGNGADYILVANQDSDLITALRFDRGTENLTLLDMKMPANKPTCILPVC
ncbi:MAG: lactonase family protein [Lachnospiraceae bacterium]|nr:lactonase family protein [Lachnospiraceae bacterium]